MFSSTYCLIKSRKTSDALVSCFLQIIWKSVLNCLSNRMFKFTISIKYCLRFFVVFNNIFVVISLYIYVTK